MIRDAITRAGIMLVVTRTALMVTAMVIIMTVIVVIATTPSTGEALTFLTRIMFQSPLAGRPPALRPLSLLG